jgi:hypothetical protein
MNETQGRQRMAVRAVYDPIGRNLQGIFACCIVSKSQGRGNGVLRE